MKKLFFITTFLISFSVLADQPLPCTYGCPQPTLPDPVAEQLKQQQKIMDETREKANNPIPNPSVNYPFPTIK